MTFTELKSIIREIINEAYIRNQKIEEVMDFAPTPKPTIKWHKNAILEVMKDGPYGPMLFLRNGKPVGLVSNFGPEQFGRNDTFILGSIAVTPSMRKTGIGRAILTHLFDTFPQIKYIKLNSSIVGKPFYHKVGGERESKNDFTIERRKFQPSTLKFEKIPFTVELQQALPDLERMMFK